MSDDDNETLTYKITGVLIVLGLIAFVLLVRALTDPVYHGINR